MKLLSDDPPRLPWTNVYGVARSLLALGTLTTLLFHDANKLFDPYGAGMAAIAANALATQFSLFTVIGLERLELARWLAVAVLAVVASGWRPRVTGVLHWWVSFSFATSGSLIEGGDQVTANLTLLLLPVTLTDPRRWHWSALDGGVLTTTRAKVLALVALSALFVVRLQVAGIYLQAAVEKTRVPEWANGTALYYWFLHPVFGAADWLRPLLMPLLLSGFGVTMLTWGAIALELALFAGLTMDRRHRPLLLGLGLLFHLGIALVHGLVAFFLAMAAALILYLRPVDQPFTRSVAWLARVREALADARRGTFPQLGWTAGPPPHKP